MVALVGAGSHNPKRQKGQVITIVKNGGLNKCLQCRVTALSRAFPKCFGSNLLLRALPHINHWQKSIKKVLPSIPGGCNKIVFTNARCLPKQTIHFSKCTPTHPPPASPHLPITNSTG
jgi:hypothetical protein